MESTRSFCSRCGTPLLYERKRSPHMLQDWAYTGNRLVPLKGYPGIVWEPPEIAPAPARR